MAYETLRLIAGQPYRHDVPGRRLLVDDIGIAEGVDIQLIRNGEAGKVMPSRKAAFLYVGDFDYEGAIFTSTVTTKIGVFMTYSQVNLGITDGATVKIPEGVHINSSVADPVHVALDAPVTIGSVTVNNSNAQAVPVQHQALIVIVDAAPVSIGTNPAVISGDATLKILRVRNGHADAALFIGGAGVTAENAAVVLQPGDLWEETSAAGAIWYGVSSGPTISVKIQGVK